MAIAGVLLTGGASRRMGRDKATLPLGPTTLAERTALLLRACTDPTVELGPGVSGLDALPDAGLGPLAALVGASALWAALPAGSHVIVVATDLPRLTGGLLAWLAAHPAPGAVIPVDGGRPQPLCARYPTSALVALAAVPPGTGRVTAWSAGLGGVLADPREWQGPAGDPLALRDADTPGDLDALAGRARS